MEIIIVLVAVGIFIYFHYKLQKPKLLGKDGENYVARDLRLLPAPTYQILNDLMLPIQTKIRTTQIDHVVVSNYGIFCIETKNYVGWIYGNRDQEQWTQTTRKTKRQFYSPVRQNQAHINALKELLLPFYPTLQIQGFIAFIAARKLILTNVPNAGTLSTIVKKIRSIKQPVLSNQQRDDIVKLLTKANITDTYRRELHNQKIRSLQR